MFSSLLVLSLAALAPLAHANVFITSPTGSSALPGGKNATIQWQDDGHSPTLQSFGNASFGVWVGDVSTQFELQTIATVDVSQVSSLSWTPNPTDGPNSNVYFIRVTSLGLKDANNSQFFAEAFSAKFTLTNMTGTFNSTVQGVISGSAPGPTGAAPTAAAGTSGSGFTTTSAAAASTVKPSSAASSAAGSSSNSNSAGTMIAPRVLGATGVAAFVFAFFL